MVSTSREVLKKSYFQSVLRKVTAVHGVLLLRVFRLGCPTGYRVSTILTDIGCPKKTGYRVYFMTD